MHKEKFINRQRQRRRYSVRNKTRGNAERPRLCVFRSGKHISCQVIDDETGKTLISAGTLEKALRDQFSNGGNTDAATAIGKVVAERAKEAGITKVKFDRGSYKYHGRVAALADAAREAGLDF